MLNHLYEEPIRVIFCESNNNYTLIVQLTDQPRSNPTQPHPNQQNITIQNRTMGLEMGGAFFEKEISL